MIAGRNGAEALQAARARGGRVDLLLTDLVMPRMTGAELAEALAGDQPHIKVLFMTGQTDDALVEDRLVDGDVELHPEAVHQRGAARAPAAAARAPPGRGLTSLPRSSPTQSNLIRQRSRPNPESSSGRGVIFPHPPGSLLPSRAGGPGPGRS